MIGRFEFEDLLESGGDGAFSPVGTTRPDTDIDALMDAWRRERQDSVECRFYLERMGRLIQRMMEEDQVPPELRKRARCLLKAVRATRRDAGDGE
jgi:hypothetical protein